MRVRSLFTAVALLFAGLVNVVTSAPAFAYGSTLAAGQYMTAGNGVADQLRSASGEYTLTLRSGTLTIDQMAPLLQAHDSTGTSTWNLYPIVPAGDRTRLVVQGDGNLVMYTAAGHAVWASRTVGSGPQNRLIMQDDGNLVMYTAAGRAVWWTATGPAILPAGRNLASGHSLINRWNGGGQTLPTTLVMQRDGNLVLLVGTRVVWNSHTFVPNSYLSMQTDNNLVIRAPNGPPVWSTGTPGHGDRGWLMITACGSMVVTSEYAVGAPYWWTHVIVPSC